MFLNPTNHAAVSVEYALTHALVTNHAQERWENVGNWTQGEKRGRGVMGVESALAVISIGGPVK
eukprot:1178193-Prorocentrum_minimum.AAC.2